MSRKSRDKGKVDWRDVPGFFPYQASHDGRIRRSPDAPPKRGAVPGRILKTPGRDDKGYVQVQLHHHATSQRQTVKVHRLVALAFLGERADDMTVNHIDADKENNAHSNLEYVSNLQNNRHARAMGLIPPTPNGKANQHSGANRPRKLNEAQVLAIRDRLKVGETRASIAAEFDIHVATVGEIARREIWAWV